MNCNDVRDALMRTRETDRAAAEHAEHFEQCAGCARYLDRLTATRELLRGHHANIEPDASFAARVVAELPSSRADLLGRAAMRLLPATVALLAILMWMAWNPGSVESSTLVVDSPTEDPLSWVLGEDGAES